MTAPIDSEAQLRRVQRVRETLRSTRLVLGLFVLLGLSSLFAATTTVAVDSLVAGIAGWFFAQVATLGLAALGLRALRRRRFGSRPSTRIHHTSDALLVVSAVAGGSLALLGFLPDVLHGRTKPMSLIILTLGAVLLLGGLRSAILYVARE